MRAVVLCGGQGVRARPLTDRLPKPLLTVGDRPILGHILDGYARHGVTSFVLAAGFRAEAVKEYATSLPLDWQVDVVDTGIDSGTGSRLTACLDLVGDRFHATYGDGVATVDLTALLHRHEQHGRGATITTVPLPSPYGTIELDDDDTVYGFVEKPTLRDHWINAGFFVFDRAVFAAHAADDLERDVLPAMAKAGVLAAYRHDGFWRSMDTDKDRQDLDTMVQKGCAPWLR